MCLRAHNRFVVKDLLTEIIAIVLLMLTADEMFIADIVTMSRRIFNEALPILV